MIGLRHARCTLALWGVLSMGCAGSPQSQFYTLTPEPSSTAPEVQSTPFPHAVAVGPVSIPEVVNRPQFVVRSGPHRVVILEAVRWAGSLKSGIAEAVAGNLGRDLSGARVTPMTQSAANDARFYVALDVQRFDMIVGEAAVIEVVWTIKQRDGALAPMLGRSDIHEPVDPSADVYDALVAAQVRALAAVSRDIARRLADKNGAD